MLAGGIARRPVDAAAAHELGAHLERGLVGRGHEHDVTSHDVADRAGQVRVVGAAEQERVDLGVDHRGEEALGEHVHLVAAGLVPLDELDGVLAGRLDRLRRRRLLIS